MTHQVTQLLIDWGNGDHQALEKLMPLVYNELRGIARQHLRRERDNHTLETTALVNEAYLRLVNQRQVQWQNRAHFFAIAAQMMRRVLLDYARMHTRAKRGGDLCKYPLDDISVLAPERSAELITLDEALKKLAAVDRRKSQVVELRYFGGLNVEETAAVLNISVNTVIRDWGLARAWLRREVSQGVT